MNRPIWNLHAYDTYEDYVKELNKYCDELERKVKLKEHQRQSWEHDYKGIESYYKDCLAQREKVLIEWSDEYYEVWRELDKYKTALNKAYELLEPFTVCIQHNFTNKTKEQWKDWALRNE